MLRRSFLLGALGVCALSSAPAPKPAPKLVLGIVIDQFRYDYLTRFRADYTAGFARFYERGAVFTSAYLEHAPTITAVGHSTFLTGATPALSGIVGNEWWDRETRKKVTSVSDPAVRLLGGLSGAEGASPRRLLVTTIGDELKLASAGRPRVIGVSSKDRGAILPAGHTADGAYWFDEKSGNFVSSTFYFEDLPAWVKEFNAARPADKYLKAEWKPLVPSPDWPSFAKTLPGTYEALEESPFSNELIAQFAERAIEAEKLGQRGVTDLLSVSFSANDYIGHDYGPHSPEVRDVSIRSDRVIGRLFDYIDSRIGLDNVLVVFTADHGVAPVPERMQKHGIGGRLTAKQVLDTVEAALDQRCGPGEWVSGSKGPDPYLNRALIRAKRLNEAQVQRAAADAVRALPHVARVYTREQLLNGIAANDVVGRRVQNGFYAPRAPDIVVIMEPYWIEAAGSGTTHGSPYGYDAHVPLVLMGPGVRPGIYHARAAANDIAPTLAALLWIEPPGGSVGRVLAEALVQ